MDRESVREQPQIHPSIAMPKFVPSGYISIPEAVNRLGRELYPAAWTGEEHKARTGLISEEEWLKTKDLSPPRGADALGGAPRRRRSAPDKSNPSRTVPSDPLSRSVPVKPQRTAGPSDPLKQLVPLEPPPQMIIDPSDPVYQAEYLARERYVAATQHLRVLLEAGRLEAVIYDPWTGALHAIPTSSWRQHNADQIIKKGEVLLPDNPNTGSILIRQFEAEGGRAKSMPEAKIAEAAMALREKSAKESLTRPQQAEFVRKNYPNLHVSERQMAKIFRAVPIRIGRPRNSNTKV
jgi:hypothetical protein